MAARRSRGRAFIGVAVAAVLLGASAGLQAARDRWLERPAVAERLLYLQSGNAVRRIAGPFDTVLADVYWIRTIQHYGRDRLGMTPGRRYQLLYPLLDATTSLDPYFSVAYRFGAFFLADAYPSGAGRPDQAIALLKKGLRAEPGKWQYAQDIGFVYYWTAADDLHAAQWYQRASQMPGAPSWMKLLAANVLAGADRQASRFLWTEILKSAESEWIQRSARFRLLQFDAMDQMDRIDAYLRPYVRTMPDDPITWERLALAGAIRRIPVDPTGVPYDLNPWWGEVAVSPESTLYPMPIERPATRAGAGR